jgi:hypothetical protein
MKSWLIGGGLALALLLAGCPKAGTDAADGDGGTDAAAPFAPDRVCPGDPDCTGTVGDGNLYVGAAMRSILPTGFENWNDADGDAAWNPDVDTFTDADGDGVFDAIWIAGFGGGRAANGVMDDLWARTVVLRWNDVTIAITAVDVVGYFRDEVELIRAALPPSLGVDLVVVAATHDHEAPDTIGIWGPELNISGVNDAFMAGIRDAVVANITDAVGALVPANVEYASTATEHPSYGYEPYVSDTRHPTVLDPTLTMLHFVRESDGGTIATLVNWAAHPEYLGSDNLLLSSDYPAWLREYITNGISDAYGTVPGVGGGVTVFINGPLGGQVGPGWVVARTPDDAMTFPSASPEKAMYAARAVASLALDALANSSVTEDTMELGFTYEKFRVHIENRGYHLYLLLGVLQREVFNYTPGTPITDGNYPEVDSEAMHLRLGRAEVITCPGELFPEFYLGGYDGSYAGTWPLIDTTEANPPDLTLAPAPPYLRDLMTGEYRMMWGLTGDMLGYIMPEFEFLLHPQTPYLKEADGDHYEETNSVGPNADSEIVGNMRNLLTWKPSN